VRALKILGLIVLFLLFLVLGIWIAFYAPIIKLKILNNNIFRKSIGFLSIVFFGVIGILISKNYLNVNTE
jgi:hypothetical protein